MQALNKNDEKWKVKKWNFCKKRFFEMKILHSLSAHQKSINWKSKDIYENEQILIE